MPIRHRRGRRQDGLYQAQLHQRIDRRIELQQERKPLSFEELYERAREAKAHNALYTFLDPEILKHLLDLRVRYLKLRGLVEGHWEKAQKEQESGHSDRDLFLWTQGLNWLDRPKE